MCARVLVAEVVDVAGRDGRQPGRGGERGELRERCRSWISQVRVLQLDVDRCRAPNTCASRSSSACASVGRFSSSALQTRPERQPDRAITPARVPLEQLPVDARLVVVALEVAEARELDQVRVARVVGREQGEVRVALRLRAAVVGDVDLAADDRLDAGSLGVALKSCTAPAIEPWSVSETAGISSSAARVTRSGIRQAPSRIEYSEWTCRWTNGASGIPDGTA